LLDGGAVRCWGNGASGRLGYGNIDSIGDNEPPSAAGDVDIGGTAVRVGAGGDFTCALLDSGELRCWGASTHGQLGYGNILTIGDDESPASAGDVPFGGSGLYVAVCPNSNVSYGHTCVYRGPNSVRCWGTAQYYGQLGYGNTAKIGDNELPSSVGDVPYI
jgi:hypothetical protein